VAKALVERIIPKGACKHVLNVASKFSSALFFTCEPFALKANVQSACFCRRFHHHRLPRLYMTDLYRQGEYPFMVYVLHSGMLLSRLSLQLRGDIPVDNKVTESDFFKKNEGRVSTKFHDHGFSFVTIFIYYFLRLKVSAPMKALEKKKKKV
jgi:hypothetical protein